jgi:hypothetical protein
VIFFLFMQNIQLLAQKEGNIWCFGDSALIDWNDPQNPVLGRSGVDSRGSCTSIADSAGNLLFYMGNTSAAFPIDTWLNCRDTIQSWETGHVYNKNHQVMENGACLNGEAWYQEHTIVPMPGNDSLYYIFSVDLYDPTSLTSDPVGICYSLVNIRANDGLGKVIERDVFVIAESDAPIYYPIDSFIKAIRHGNGRDWWVIAKATPYGSLGNNFILLLVNSEGISVQYLPNERPICYSGLSRGIFSEDGTKYLDLCPYFPDGDIVIYDFDRCTGALTNQRVIDTISNYIEGGPDGFYWAACFSPSSRFLYVSNYPGECDTEAVWYGLQYDLNDSFPALTKDTIYTTYSVNTNFYRNTGDLLLAPDGKIYHTRSVSSCTNGVGWPYPNSWRHPWNENLSVINHPDSLYPACNYEPYSFYLGGARTYLGLPNNPNYKLGAVEDSCNMPSALNPLVVYKKNELNIFPNPCLHHCQIQYKPAREKGNITIVNSQGKVVFYDENIPVTLLQYGYEINTAAFAAGSYLLTLTVGTEVISKTMLRM